MFKPHVSLGGQLSQATTKGNAGAKWHVLLGRALASRSREGVWIVVLGGKVDSAISTGDRYCRATRPLGHGGFCIVRFDQMGAPQGGG